jgi:predicted GNAT family acetyltransferase
VDLSFYKSYISEEIRAEGEARRAVEDVLEVLEASSAVVIPRPCAAGTGAP